MAVPRRPRTIRLADLGDELVAVVIRDLRPNNIPQQLLRVFGPEGRDVGAVDLPGSADCSPDLARVGHGWAVVCTSPGGRTGAATGVAHLLDGAFGITRSAPLELESGEKALAWLGTERGLSIITDRARRLIVNADGTVQSSLVDAQLAGAYLTAPARLSGDRVVAGWVSTGPGPRAAGVVMISTVEGRVTARLDDPDGPPLGFAAAHDRLYALTPRGSDRWALQRLDPLTLARVGAAAVLPTQDDIRVYGLISFSHAPAACAAIHPDAVRDRSSGHDVEVEARREEVELQTPSRTVQPKERDMTFSVPFQGQERKCDPADGLCQTYPDDVDQLSRLRWRCGDRVVRRACVSSDGKDFAR